MPFDWARIGHGIRNQGHDLSMSDEAPDPYAHEVKSIYEIVRKWFWLIFCAICWIGVILSIFTGAPASSILIGAIIASGLSGFYYLAEHRNFFDH